MISTCAVGWKQDGGMQYAVLLHHHQLLYHSWSHYLLGRDVIIDIRLTLAAQCPCLAMN